MHLCCVIFKHKKMNTKKVWFITGASKGLGLILVKKLLTNGFNVAATSRNKQALINEIGKKNESFLPIEMDLTQNENVKKAIEATIVHFGQIDIIVNNAGYSQIGTLEELTEVEVRNNFNVNVFGSLNVIRNAAQYLRKQQSGHIFNIASIGGYTGNFAGFGIYCSTKFAVAGFTEALAEEMKSFNVNTTLVYPGYFRTNFLSEGSIKTPLKKLASYKGLGVVFVSVLLLVKLYSNSDSKNALIDWAYICWPKGEGCKFLKSFSQSNSPASILSVTSLAKLIVDIL